MSLVTTGMDFERRKRDELWWAVNDFVLQTGTALFDMKGGDTGRFAAERAEQHLWAGAWHDEPIGLASACALALALSAGDHLEGLASAVAHPTPSSFAVDTLARGSMEAAARSCWMSDPEVEGDVRVQRLMTELLYSNGEQRKLMHPHGGATQIPIPDQAILETADALGWRRVGKKPLGIGRGRPTATELLAKAAGQAVGEFTYRMLSAGAHGTIYSLLGRSSVRFAAHGLGVDLPKAPSQADATHHLRLLAARATELSCEVLLTATLSQAEWLGYPIESLEAMLIAYSNATTLAIACQY